jgi:sugar transferase (PEP-CTERM/EpsH1 system associated)
VDLACLADEPVTDATRQELTSLCRRVAIIPLSKKGRWIRAIASILRGRSASAGLFESLALRQSLAQWAADTTYDAVLLFCSSMGQYLDAGQLSQCGCVVDLIDVDSEKWFEYADNSWGPVRWLYRLEGRRVRQLERELAKRVKVITVVSDSEAALLQQFCPDADVQVVTNGVNVDYFDSPDAYTSDDHHTLSTAEPECVFVGALDYYPNVDGVMWFSHNVWPAVKKLFPKSSFTIVGRRPIGQISRLSREPGIKVVGDVADVRSYLHRASVVIVPLRVARGIQNKVLEALAAGKAVVASPKAIEGLGLAAGEHLLKASTIDEWVTSLRSLFGSDDKRRQLARAGQAFVREHHRWNDCLKPLHAILENAAQPARRHSVPDEILC